MNNRQYELAELKGYIENIDKETTLLLQNLQWDYKQLLRSAAMVSCQHVASHRIPLQRKEAHEKQCYLTQHGYAKDVLLPDLINPDADTVVKLSKQEINQIIEAAASTNPLFKRACLARDVARSGPEPLSAARLQQTYSADERRAIHDAVVSAAPACHDLADLALPSASNGSQTSKVKSRLEVLAELRDMKRRRAKYRVAAKTSNYSDVLRDVIKTQMESYAEAKGICIKTEYGSKTYVSLNKPDEDTTTDIIIKQERLSPEANNYDSSIRYSERSRSREKRRREHEEEPASKRRKDHHDSIDYSSDKNRHKDSSHGRYKYSSKERSRYNEYQTKRDGHYKVREDIDTIHDRNRHDDKRKDFENTKKSSDSMDSQKYDDYSRRKHSKHDRHYGNGSSKDTRKYDDDFGKHSRHDRNHKDESSMSSKYYSRKHGEYQDYNRNRDQNREQYHNVKIKKEKNDR